jgi:rSAM/selenodomain-associated transferase 2
LASERLSIIIPVLNEEARIRKTLADLVGLGAAEVIVADGGSVDGTRALASLATGVRVIRAPPGRGPQMNAGAAAATGDVLLFLHADVRLPASAWRDIQAALGDSDVVGGAFRTHTVADDGRTRPARWLRLADLRSRYFRLPYGDQAVFVRRAAFQRIGGFPAVPLFEDLEFSRRLWRVGRVRTLPSEVTVSGRRFLARPVYYAVVMTVFPVLSRLGVRPSTLARWYDGDLARVYDQIAKARGGVADIHQCQSLNVRALLAHLELYKAIMFLSSPLSRAWREAIAVAVSRATQCAYCEAHHAAALEALGGAADVPPALLDWAARLAREPERSSVDDVRALRALGLDDRAILDAVLTVAYFSVANRLVMATGLEIEAGYEQTCRPTMDVS